MPATTVSCLVAGRYPAHKAWGSNRGARSVAPCFAGSHSSQGSLRPREGPDWYRRLIDPPAGPLPLYVPLNTEDAVATVCVVHVELVANEPAAHGELVLAAHKVRSSPDRSGCCRSYGERVRTSTNAESVGFGAGVLKKPTVGPDRFDANSIRVNGVGVVSAMVRRLTAVKWREFTRLE